jgi:hypothetical protein
MHGNTPIEITLFDVCREEEDAPRQTVRVKPASDQVMLHLLDPAGADIGYVCVEVHEGKVVLDYSTVGDFAAGPHSTERVELRDLAVS